MTWLLEAFQVDCRLAAPAADFQDELLLTIFLQSDRGYIKDTFLSIPYLCGIDSEFYSAAIINVLLVG